MIEPGALRVKRKHAFENVPAPLTSDWRLDLPHARFVAKTLTSFAGAEYCAAVLKAYVRANSVLSRLPRKTTG